MTSATSRAEDAARVIPIPNGRFVENCYLVAPAGASDAVIVDPGEEPERFLRVAEREGLTIREIWLTHAHIDHVLGVAAIKAATGAPILLHPDDLPLYQGVAQQGELFGIRVPPLPPPDRWIVPGEPLRLGELEIGVRFTPGHSPGSVCFVGPGLVLGGDVLFQRSIGRTDLPGGDLRRLLRSIQEELFSLPDETVVFPGHGPETTIGAERRDNPFLVPR